MKKLIAFAVLLLTGCTTVTNWSATGGSRADATIKLSHPIGAFVDVKVSESQAIELAKERCRTWGYTGAEAFGGETLTCNRMSNFGDCENGIVTKEYQCTGQGNTTTGKSISQL